MCIVPVWQNIYCCQKYSIKQPSDNFDYILNTSLAFIELQNFSQFLFPQNIVTMDIFMDILGNGSV